MKEFKRMTCPNWDTREWGNGIMTYCQEDSARALDWYKVYRLVNFQPVNNNLIFSFLCPKQIIRYINSKEHTVKHNFIFSSKYFQTEIL